MAKENMEPVCDQLTSEEIQTVNRENQTVQESKYSALFILKFLYFSFIAIIAVVNKIHFQITPNLPILT